MTPNSKLTKCTAWLLLGLLTSTFVGFVTIGMAHTLEHEMALKTSSATEVHSSEPIRLAGCRPAGEANSGEDAFCPGCREHENASVVMVKYYTTFTARTYPPAYTLLYLEKEVGLIVDPSNQNDQFAPEPVTPPPKQLSTPA